MTWVYIQTDKHEKWGLWTVGFYRPDGVFVAESDHGKCDEAAERCAYLNGGDDQRIHDLENSVEALEEWRQSVEGK